MYPTAEAAANFMVSNNLNISIDIGMINPPYSLDKKDKKSSRGRIGIPLALGMYELLPLWYGLFDDLGFDVIVSNMSTKRTYEKGQFSIPSDTACYQGGVYPCE